MTRVKVALRIRPLSPRESIADGSKSILAIEGASTIVITNIKVPEQNAGDSRERTRRFTFDLCFSEDSTQTDVFDAVEGIVKGAVAERYSACILAYGQSSSGKTHTMMGFPHDPGLTPRLCQQVFGYLQDIAIGEEIAHTRIAVSYLEIYNEKVRDLLGPVDHHRSPVLKIRQHPQKGPYVQGLSEHPVLDAGSLLQILQTGNSNRSVAATLTNPTSSRSHSVFILKFCGIQLTLVDLAGSERAVNRCCSTSRLREGANINKSLVALGNVISALAEEPKGVRRRFIPYRDSILTWLLKDTLGGNCRTLMIATVSPSSTCYSETVNTLRFGQRAKLIVSVPVVNEDPKERIIRELRSEIAKLRELIKTHTSPNNISMDHGVNPEAPSKEEKLPLKTTERLLPVMSFAPAQSAEKKPLARLRRTFSVDHKPPELDEVTARKFGSQETVVAKKKFSPSSSMQSLRKRSIDKTSLLKQMVQKKDESMKLEKSVATECTKPFTKVEAKVDSIRRPVGKPRSQIVAAVTQRLYAKVKRRDIATDTSDIAVLPEKPKELMICSNARLRLKELTKKALKAHRSRNEETQTDLFPVQRVKETSTDVSDLRTALKEIHDNETSTTAIQMEDKEVNCTFDKNFDLDRSLILTRTCGTQSTEKAAPAPKPTGVSFTEYLKNPPKPNIEFFNPHTANPIYTSSVNINISHNYLDGQRIVHSVSDDSLEDDLSTGAPLPAPDLLSNHNSLEPHTAAAANQLVDSGDVLHYAQFTIVNQEEFEVYGELGVASNQPKSVKASSQVVPECCELGVLLNIPLICAPQVCVCGQFFDGYCEFFTSVAPEMAKPNVIECKGYNDDCIQLLEPLVLKSIMKHMPDTVKKSTTSDDEYLEVNDNLLDSLEYHMANSKKVHFNSKTQSDRMLKAMSGFLEEATILMNNLAETAAKLKIKDDVSSDYEVQVTVNNISGLHRQKSRRKRKCHHRRDAKCQTDEEKSPKQTFPVPSSSLTQIYNFDIPVNKYELLLEDSCRRLEAKIDSVSEPLFQDEEDRWDLNVQDEVEDVSLESNAVTFSDYGSLPRRKYNRHRVPSCSPSALLRQLASIRRQVVDSTREELFNMDKAL